jgi:hypothetical protein
MFIYLLLSIHYPFDWLDSIHGSVVETLVVSQLSTGITTTTTTTTNMF